MGSGKGSFSNTFGQDGSLLSRCCNELLGEMDIFVSAALKICLPRLYTHKINGPTHHDDSSKILSFQQFGFSSSFFSNKLHQDGRDNDLSAGQFEGTFGAHYERGRMGNRVTFEEDTYRKPENAKEEWARCYSEVLVSL
jgi:hypothetical protein